MGSGNTTARPLVQVEQESLWVASLPRGQKVQQSVPAGQVRVLRWTSWFLWPGELAGLCEQVWLDLSCVGYNESGVAA